MPRSLTELDAADFWLLCYFSETGGFYMSSGLTFKSLVTPFVWKNIASLVLSLVCDWHRYAAATKAGFVT